MDNQRKDNVISSQNKTIETLRQKLKSQQHRVVVDNYIIGPQMVVLDLQNKLQRSNKREEKLKMQVEQVEAKLRELGFKLEMKVNDLKLQEKMQKVTEEQMDQLRKHIAALTTKSAQ